MSVYSADMIPIGNKVLLRKLIPTLDKRYGNILLPQSYAKNASLGIAEIINFGNGPEVKESGLNIGDYVLYDYYSVFQNNKDYVITNMENIILRITAEEAESYLERYVLT
jgi:co-chaperonin GroES (HSP10)